MKSISDFDLCTQPVKFMLASPVHCSAFPLVWYKSFSTLATALPFEQRYQLDSLPQDKRDCSLSTPYTSAVNEIEVEQGAARVHMCL
jgi:hypothetical protein